MKELSHGVKETKEAIVGVMEIAVVIAEALKDGAKASDINQVFQKLSTDPVIKAKIEAAFDQVEKIPDEMGDCSLFEGFELSVTASAYVPKMLEIFTKPKQTEEEKKASQEIELGK